MILEYHELVDFAKRIEAAFEILRKQGYACWSMVPYGLDVESHLKMETDKWVYYYQEPGRSRDEDDIRWLDLCRDYDTISKAMKAAGLEVEWSRNHDSCIRVSYTSPLASSAVQSRLKILQELADYCETSDSGIADKSALERSIDFIKAGLALESALELSDNLGVRISPALKEAFNRACRNFRNPA